MPGIEKGSTFDYELVLSVGHFGRHLGFPLCWIPKIGIQPQIRNERPQKPYEGHITCHVSVTVLLRTRIF